MTHTVTVSDEAFSKIQPLLDQGLSQREAFDQLLRVGTSDGMSSGRLSDPNSATELPTTQLTLDEAIKRAKLEEIKERTKWWHVRRFAFESRMPRSAQIRNEMEKDTAEPDERQLYCRTCNIPIFEGQEARAHMEAKHRIESLKLENYGKADHE